MFRLLESGLPKDKVFPADMECLEYFINNDDEIRNIGNPRAYFNYFLTKSDRCNNIQREAMNTAIREEVGSRLTDLGLNVVRLPLGAKETEKHVPILMSKNIRDKKRIIILFYEHSEDLGIFAYRIVGGRGGINKGSAVDFVKYIQSLPSLPENGDSPGIILANMGQLLWYRQGKRAVTWKTWNSLPQRNAVSGPLKIDRVENRIPDNANPTEHVKYIFNNVVNDLLDPMAALDVIGVSDGANEVVQFLNNPTNWQKFGPRLNALALIAPYYSFSDLTNPDFRIWLRKRGRAYPFIGKPRYQAVGGPNGGPECLGYGCNAYSLGDELYREFLLPLHYRLVLNWLQEVINDLDYENEDLGFPVEEEDHGKDGIDQDQEDKEDVWSTANIAVTQENDNSETEAEGVDLPPDTPGEEADGCEVFPERATVANVTNDDVGDIGKDNDQANYNGCGNEDDNYPDASDMDSQEVDAEPIKAWAWKVGPEDGDPDNEPEEAKAKYKSAKCSIIEARARLDQAKEQYDVAAAQVDKVEAERQNNRSKLVKINAELGQALTQVRDFDRNIFQAESDVTSGIRYIPPGDAEVAQISSWKGRILEFRERASTFIEKTNHYLNQAKEYEQKIVELKDMFQAMKLYRDAYTQALKKYTEMIQSLMKDSETEDSETDIDSFYKESDLTKTEIGVKAGDAGSDVGNGERDQKINTGVFCAIADTQKGAIYHNIAANEREIEAIGEKLTKDILEDMLKGQNTKIEVLNSFLGNFPLTTNEGGANIERKNINPTPIHSATGIAALGDNFENIPAEEADVMSGHVIAEK